MLEPKRASSFVFFEAAFDLLQIFGAHTWCGFHRLHIVLIDCHPSNPFGVWIYISYFIASEIRQNRNKRLTTICGQKSARNFSIFFPVVGLEILCLGYEKIYYSQVGRKYLGLRQVIVAPKKQTNNWTNN